LHFSKDYPDMLPEAVPTVLEPSNYYSLLDRHHGHPHRYSV
jgi:L-aspartate oxidase